MHPAQPRWAKFDLVDGFTRGGLHDCWHHGHMSSSSPSDLSITFRSVPRRLREATGDAPAVAVAGPSGELQDRLREAAALLGSGTDPEAIADAIDAVPADAWNQVTLDSLRAVALDVGQLLRAIAAIADGDA